MTHVSSVIRADGRSDLRSPYDGAAASESIGSDRRVPASRTGDRHGPRSRLVERPRTEQLLRPALDSFIGANLPGLACHPMMGFMGAAALVADTSGLDWATFVNRPDFDDCVCETPGASDSSTEHA